MLERIALTLLATSFILLASEPQPCLAAQVRITNVDPISLGHFNGTTALEGTDTVCIYNDTTTSYTVEVSGTVVSGSLVLPRDGGGANVAIEVAFRGSSGGYVTLLPDSMSSTFSAANTSSQTCSGSTNATIRISATTDALLAVPMGDYSGVISITIYPA